MNLYRITYDDLDGNPHYHWEGTQADAKRCQTDLERRFGRRNVEDFVPFEVPTDKPNLLLFLNTYATRED